MKNIKVIAATGLIAAVIGGLALAQTHRDRHHGHGAVHPFKDADSFVEHVTEAFPRFAAFDANKDGQFDSMEQEALAKALAEGTLQFPAHMPHGVSPNAEMLQHIPFMYAQLAPFDVNQDGAFDAAEQAALKSAIERGELKFPREQNAAGTVSVSH